MTAILIIVYLHVAMSFCCAYVASTKNRDPIGVGILALLFGVPIWFSVAFAAVKPPKYQIVERVSEPTVAREVAA